MSGFDGIVIYLSLEFSLSGLKEIVESPMDPQTQNTSLQRLQNVENVKFWKTHSFLRDFIGRFDVNVFLCFYSVHQPNLSHLPILYFPARHNHQ